MLEEVRIVEVEGRALAVVRRTASLAELPGAMTAALDIIWPFLREHGLEIGHNVVLYHDQVFHFDIGVEVFGDIPENHQVIASSTPAGRVATVVYWGPYEELSLAHTAIARTCIANGLKVAGPNWEVYGDWDADPQKRRTEVFYLLRE